jgi:hypothetical protein
MTMSERSIGTDGMESSGVDEHDSDGADPRNIVEGPFST